MKSMLRLSPIVLLAAAVGLAAGGTLSVPDAYAVLVVVAIPVLAAASGPFAGFGATSLAALLPLTSMPVPVLVLAGLSVVLHAARPGRAETSTPGRDRLRLGSGASAFLAAAWAAFADTPVVLAAAALAGLVAFLSWSNVNRRSSRSSTVTTVLAAVSMTALPALAVVDSASGSTPTVVSQAAASQPGPSVGMVLLTGGAALVLLLASMVALRSKRAAATRVAAVVSSLVLATTLTTFQVPEAAGSEADDHPFSVCLVHRGDTFSSLECFAQVLIEKYHVEGAVRVVDFVKESYFLEGPIGAHFAPNCHESLHFFARTVYTDLGRDADAALRLGTDMCGGGYYHGVWEEKYGEMSTEDFLAQAPSVCRGRDGWNRSDEGSTGNGCRHILGHILASRFRGAVETVAPVCLLRDPLIDPSTPVSEDEGTMRNSCLAGLFMENALDTFRFRPDDFDASNPFALCEKPEVTADENITWGCYNEVGPFLLSVTNFEMIDAMGKCRDQALERGLSEYVRHACYDAVVRSSAPVYGFDGDGIIGACLDSKDAELRGQCVIYAVTLTSFDSNDIVGSLTRCRTADIEDVYAQECLARVRSVARLMETSETVSDGDLEAPTADTSTGLD